MMQLTVVFSDRHNELVWDEATRVVDELVKTDAWAGGKSVSIPHVVNLIEKACLAPLCGSNQELTSLHVVPIDDPPRYHKLRCVLTER